MKVRFKVGIAVIALAFVLATFWVMQQDAITKQREENEISRQTANGVEQLESAAEPPAGLTAPAVTNETSREALQLRGEIARQRTAAAIRQNPQIDAERKGYPVSLDAVPARSAIDLYAATSGRVVLHGPQVALNERISVREDDPLTPKDQMLGAIKTALESKGIVLEESGDKFLFAINPQVTGQLPAIHVRPTEPGDEEKSRSHLNFENVPANQALAIYEDLSGRKSVSTAASPFFVTLQTSGVSLTKNETLAALEICFELRGFKIEHQEDNSFVVNPIKPKR